MFVREENTSETEVTKLINVQFGVQYIYIFVSVFVLVCIALCKMKW